MCGDGVVDEIARECAEKENVEWNHIDSVRQHSMLYNYHPIMSNCPNTSLVPISKDTISLVIPAMSSEISALRQDLRDNAIRELMSWRFSLVFWPYSRQDAERIVDSTPEMFGEYWRYVRWQFARGEDEELMEKLEAAVQVTSGDEIFLSLEDAKTIQRYLKK